MGRLVGFRPLGSSQAEVHNHPGDTWKQTLGVPSEGKAPNEREQAGGAQ